MHHARIRTPCKQTFSIRSRQGVPPLLSSLPTARESQGRPTFLVVDEWVLRDRHPPPSPARSSPTRRPRRTRCQPPTGPLTETDDVGEITFTCPTPWPTGHMTLAEALRAHVGNDAIICDITTGRGYHDAKQILGADLPA